MQLKQGIRLALYGLQGIGVLGIQVHVLLACLIWAREHGCDWDEETYYLAVYKGHLDCLIWLGYQES